MLFVLISANLLAQEIPDYKGEYVFTNSKVSMRGIRELITHEEQGKVPTWKNKNYFRFH